MWQPKDSSRSWSRKRRTLVERFWEKVDVQGPDECWIWLGSTVRHGYGNFEAGNGRTLRAHRVSYELANGPIPAACVICHRCDQPQCVNPMHLFAASQSVNLHDMVSKGRSTRGEQSPAAKLDNQAVMTIRSSGVTQIEMARRFGVSPMTISLAKRRLTWTHL